MVCLVWYGWYVYHDYYDNGLGSAVILAAERQKLNFLFNVYVC